MKKKFSPKLNTTSGMIINWKSFPYKCNCKEHVYKCVTQAMWDALEEELYESSAE